MKIMLDKIIEECTNRNIKVYIERKDDGIAYRVMGFSKSGSALLYIEDEVLICETRYGQKDHIINFNDLALVAIHWYENYKDREPFNYPEEEWEPVFKTLFHMNKGSYSIDCEDLPF